MCVCVVVRSRVSAVVGCSWHLMAVSGCGLWQFVAVDCY